MLISPLLLLLSAMAQDHQSAQDPRNLANQDPTPVPARHTELSRKLAKMSADHPLVVAHRGEPIDFPENTMAAFESALAVSSHMVELDFRQSKDGALVVIHDKTVDRTTDAEQRFGTKGLMVSNLTLEQLSELDAGSWKDPKHRSSRIPTLEAALKLIQGSSITMIEHKAGDSAALVALLRQLDLVDKVMVQSFDWDWLREVHAAEPSLTIGALGEGSLDVSRMAELRGTGACILHWDYSDLSPESVKLAREHDYLLCAYTVNHDIALMGAAAIGLHLITTNRPARLQELIRMGKAKRQ